MKSGAVKILTITVLLLAVALSGNWRASSFSDKKSLSQVADEPLAKRLSAKANVEPLTYRSPGTAHKLLVPHQEAALAERLLASKSVKKARKYGAFTLLEVSDESFTRLDPQVLERLQLRDDFNLILLRRGQLDTTAPEPSITPALRQEKTPAPALHLVQLFGPPTNAAINTLKATGAHIVSYIPNNAYLIWATATQRARVEALRQQSGIIQWDAPFHPAYKLDPRLKLDSVEQLPISIEVLDRPQAAQTIAKIKAQAVKVLMPEFKAAGTVQIKILIECLRLTELAQLPDVVSIESWSKFKLHDERANQIIAGSLVNESINNILVTRPASPGYMTFLNALGFNATLDFVIDIGDTGLDNGTTSAATLHPDFLDNQGRSRIAYQHDFTHNSSATPTHDPFGHGTINASIIAGNNNGATSAFRDALGYQYGLGVVPFARLGVSRLFDDNNDFVENLSLSQFFVSAYSEGARITNDSWGLCTLDLGFCNVYNSDSRAFDTFVRDIDPNTPGYQQMVVIFSAGNDGADAPQSIAMPGTAKNVITVGASEGFRPSDANGVPLKDGCNVGSTLADNVQDIVDFSSGGPVQDGRAKPDLVAPGTHITGAATQDPAYAPKKNEDIGVCDHYFPSDQTLYTWSSGTSHSTPLVTGGAALAFQWLKTRFATEPSAALVKAMLLNSTSYLSGKGANDNLPGAKQGWGLLNIARMFEATDRIIYDESPTRTFTQSGGQPFEITGVITDPAKEFRAMLVWSDAPGTPLSNAPYVNQLNLELTINGVTYKGNVFQGQYSKAGGQADFLNNAQGIRLPAGTTGPFVLRVKPTIIAGDGEPFNGVELDQDFALVVTNGREMPTPILHVATTRVGNIEVDDISVTHSNGTTDRSFIPGETASVKIAVRNASATTAANVSAATLSFVGLQNPTPLSFPNILANATMSNENGVAVQVPATQRCGALAEMVLTLTTPQGNILVPFKVQIGRLTSSLTFFNDDVDSGNVRWKPKKGFFTASGVALSGTQSYHVVDPGLTKDDFLLSTLSLKKPVHIPATAANVRLSFYHIYNFEPGFDGGVMEVSLDDGATWEDLGARIMSGGYDGKVTGVVTSKNPLGTRSAWTSRGRAGVFSQVVINMDEFVGKAIRLRFVAGFDGATGILNGYTGWYIDDIKITADSASCP
ncbi:MAG: S8 family serine peptidase [Acidobacteria bacterium]|nr:S8 family serine peptidase [Acidobacteriota bacterium]